MNTIKSLKASFTESIQRKLVSLVIVAVFFVSNTCAPVGLIGISCAEEIPNIAYITQDWLNSHGTAPYGLDQANTTYILETDVSAEGSCFILDADGVTLDLNGHTVTYNTATGDGVYGCSAQSGKRSLRVTNGELVQGEGNGYKSCAVYFDGTSGIEADHLTVSYQGDDNIAVYCRGVTAAAGDTKIHDNTIRPNGIKRVSAQDGNIAAVLIDQICGNIDIRNNSIEGKGYDGISLNCLTGAAYNILINNNTVKVASSVIGGDAIRVTGTAMAGPGFEIANNIIAQDSGRGILINGPSSGTEQGPGKGTIHDNNIEASTGICLKSGAHDIKIYNNTVKAYAGKIFVPAGAEPGCIARGIVILSGYQGKNIDVYNNTVETETTDAALTASGICAANNDPKASYDANVVFHNNTVTSNSIILDLNFEGGSGSYQVFRSNALIKGPDPVDFCSIRSGYGDGLSVKNVFLDNSWQNGADGNDVSLALSGGAEYSLYTKWYLNISVKDPVTDQPVAGAKIIASAVGGAGEKISGVTNEAGDVSLVLIERYRCGTTYPPTSDYTEYSPYTITISKAGYMPTSMPVSVDQSMQLMIYISKDNLFTLNTLSTNGTITRNPARSFYAPGSKVELTAVPNTGYKFMDWDRDIKGSSNPVTITMDGNKTVTANFEPSTYAIDIKAKNGSVTKSPDKARYEKGEKVTLTAVPVSGYSFKRWRGDAKGAINPITLTMNESMNIAADFIAVEGLNASAGPNGTISPSGNIKLIYGSDQTFTITPDPGCHISKVLVDGVNVGPVSSYTFTNITRSHTINAKFESDTFALNISTSNGYVTKLPDKTRYEKGEKVILTASPMEGHVFTGWTGDAKDKHNPITITMNENKTITASFVRNPYNLDIKAKNGSVTKSPDKARYEKGEKVTLTAVPVSGYIFKRWKGDAKGENNPVTITIDGNMAVTADFAPDTYTIDIKAKYGSVAKSPDKARYEKGEKVTLTAIPISGYNFKRWKGDAKGENNPVTITIDGNMAVTADFDPNTYTLDIKANNGSVTKSPDKARYEKGEKVVLTAVPASDYSFKRWKGDAKGVINTITITMNESMNITADFEPDTYTLDVKAKNGSVTVSPDKERYEKGDKVVLTAVSGQDYNFKRWTGDAAGAANPVTITMDKNKKITAEFSPDTYILEIKAKNGSVTKSPDKARYEKGEKVVLTAVPGLDYIFNCWKGGAKGTTNPVTITMDKNKTVTADFEAVKYTLEIKSKHGFVTISPNKPKYEKGEKATLTAVPESGYSFKKWTGGVKGSLNPVTITMDKDKTVTAVFDKDTLVIKAGAY